MMGGIELKKVFTWLIIALLMTGYVCSTIYASDGEQTDENPFSVIGGWFADRGKDIENVTTAAGEAVANAATATGEAIANAATVTGEAVANAAVVTGDAVVNAATVTGEAVTSAAVATGDAVVNAATVTGDAVTNAAVATGEWASNTASMTGEAVSNAALTAGQWVGDRTIDVGNAAVETGELAVLAVQNADPSKLLDKQYYLDSLEKTALGDYSDKDPTFLSIGLNLAASVANVDAPMDIRDLSYDLSNLDSEDVTAGRIALDAVGLLPLIGGLKYIKHIDTIADGARAAGKAADAASDLRKTLNTVADVADTVHDAAKTADSIDAVHDAAKMVDALDDVHDTAKAANVVDDVHDAAKAVDVVDDAHDTAKAVDVADDMHDATKTADISNDVSETAKNTDTAIDAAQEISKRGGSYAEVFKNGEGGIYEVHHMPADSVTNLDRLEGPAIKMDIEDHRRTASYGATNEAREYRKMQEELIKKGEFQKALQMDIDDIRSKFGNKYDDAIEEMEEYVRRLIREGKING